MAESPGAVEFCLKRGGFLSRLGMWREYGWDVARARTCFWRRFRSRRIWRTRTFLQDLDAYLLGSALTPPSYIVDTVNGNGTTVPWAGFTYQHVTGLLPGEDMLLGHTPTGAFALAYTANDDGDLFVVYNVMSQKPTGGLNYETDAALLYENDANSTDVSVNPHPVSKTRMPNLTRAYSFSTLPSGTVFFAAHTRNAYPCTGSTVSYAAIPGQRTGHRRFLFAAPEALSASLIAQRGWNAGQPAGLRDGAAVCFWGSDWEYRKRNLNLGCMAADRMTIESATNGGTGVSAMGTVDERGAVVFERSERRVGGCGG